MSDFPRRSDDGMEPLRRAHQRSADMANHVCRFIGELQDRVWNVQVAWQAGDLDNLRTLAGELKWVAHSHGLHEITSTAGDLECGLMEQMAVSSIGERVETLVLLCRRACATTPGPEAEGAD